MELFDTLASIGITTRVLQIIVVAAIAIVLVGLYWRYIVIGAGILFCVVVFAMPSKQDKPVEVKALPEMPQVEKLSPEVQQVEPAPPVAEVRNETKEESDERMFLEDCKLHSGYTSAQCTALWNDQKSEIEKSMWRYKHGKKLPTQKVKYGFY